MSNMLNLPAERVEQLRAIAAARRLPTVTAAIGYLIRKEIAAGTIPADLPGISIKKNAKGVAIGFDDRTPTIYAKADAAKLARTIRDVALGEAAGLADITGNWIVVGRGTGVKVHVPAGSDARTFSRDLALDLADLIETAAE